MAGIGSKAVIDPSAIKNGHISVDVMDRDNGRFICTERMPASPLFQVTVKELADWLLHRRPSLKYKNIEILLN